jgi:hypothetical protein
MKVALWFLAAVFVTPAVAGPCDGVSDPMAFNACLASHGPAAHKVHVGPAPAANPVAAPAARSMRTRRAAGRLNLTQRRGRSELVFSPRK